MNSAALVITTYNWPAALDLVLASAAFQSRAPAEIHIADDGSKDDTKHIVQLWQKRLDIPIYHHWHEDNGFRPNPVRNESAANVTSDIMITIDGDMIMHPKFIEDHIKFSKPGHFIQSRRVRLTRQLTQRALNERKYKFSLFTRGITRRFQAFRNPLLAMLSTNVDTSMRNIRGANMSMWHKDFVAINGFNEDIVGWGFEDHDLTARFYNHGLKRTYVRHAALAYHLDHDDNSREHKDKNKAILEQSQKNAISRVANGLAENHTIKRNDK